SRRTTRCLTPIFVSCLLLTIVSVVQVSFLICTHAGDFPHGASPYPCLRRSKIPKLCSPPSNPASIPTPTSPRTISSPSPLNPSPPVSTGNATFEFDADDSEICVPCYPIESIFKFETKTSESSGWSEVTNDLFTGHSVRLERQPSGSLAPGFAGLERLQ